jgi:membrane protease YdiL (CAAX protease family)
MNSMVVQELLKFDPHKPMASIQVQLLATVAVLVLSTLTFTVVLRVMMPKSFSDQMEEDRDSEYEALKRKGVTMGNLMFGEILNGSIHAPIAEELFFRFFLFKLVFVRIFKMNPHSANFLQAAIFGALHLSNTVYSDQGKGMSTAQSISSGITGLICGYSYYYTNSIIPAILAHTINNLIASYDQLRSYRAFLHS